MLKTSVVSGMTFLSRILGLVRDIVFARYFGASLVMDAFLVANRIPNMLRRFFAEGAFSQGFVPVMARYREKHSHEDAREFVDSVAGTFGVILFLVTLAGVVAAPLLVAIVAPGLHRFTTGASNSRRLMLRFTFPYLFFVSLTAFAGGILNTYGKFRGAGLYARYPERRPDRSLPSGLAPTSRRARHGAGLRGIHRRDLSSYCSRCRSCCSIRALPRPKWNVTAHEGVRQRQRRLALPAIFGSSVAQINVLRGRHHRVYARCRQDQPVVLLGPADGVPARPVRYRPRHRYACLTCHVSAANESHVTSSRHTLDWSMKLVLLIAVPAADRADRARRAARRDSSSYGGVFTAIRCGAHGARTAGVCAVGLVGFSYVKILAPAYFAREKIQRHPCASG